MSQLGIFIIFVLLISIVLLKIYFIRCNFGPDVRSEGRGLELSSFTIILMIIVLYYHTYRRYQGKTSMSIYEIKQIN